MLGSSKLGHCRVLFGSLAVLALGACGGGSGNSAAVDAVTSGTSSPTTPSNTQTGAITLSNLPTARTLSTSASISYESAATGGVYCRLDSYLPIVCPNPLVLGATDSQALSAGTHTVDYFVDSGSGIDLSNPTSTYSWTVESTAPAPAPAPAPATSVPSTPVVPVSTGVTPLAFANASGARIEAPSDADSTGYGTKSSTNGGSVLPLSNLATVTRGGITRFGPTTVDGRSAIMHRIRQGDPLRNNGDRSELSYGSFNFANGEDVWFAAAYKFDADCDPATSGGDSDRMLIQQTHQNATSSAPIGNPFSLTLVGGGLAQGLNWTVTYQGNDLTLYRTPIVIGQWMRVITHYRSGFTGSGHAPIMEAWVAYGNGSYTKLSTLSGMSANQQFGDPLSTPGSNNDWPKIGLYKWTSGSWGSSPSRTVYTSGLYASKGSNLFNESAAALAAAGF